MKISIIIPVYNTEKYLEHCLESVVHQSDQEYEIVCVDDGSTDNSSRILSEYEIKYAHVHVYHKENGGLSSARNFGVRKSQGEYVVFLDSDDAWDGNDCLKFIRHEIEQDCLDVFYFDRSPVFENKMMQEKYEKLAPRRMNKHGFFNQGVELMSSLVAAGEYATPAVLQCIRKDLIQQNNLYFLDKVLHEDNLFTFQVMLAAGPVKHSNRRIYQRMFREGSIMTSPFTFDNVNGYFQCWKHMISTINGMSSRIMPYRNSVLHVIDGVRNEMIYQYNKLPQGEKERVEQLTQGDQYLFALLTGKNAMAQSLMKHSAYIFPYHLFSYHDRIVIYGAGRVGKIFYDAARESEYITLVGIVDKNADKISNENFRVQGVEALKGMMYDFVLIAIERMDVAKKARKDLLQIGILPEKITWDGHSYSYGNWYKNCYYPMLKNTQFFHPFFTLDDPSIGETVEEEKNIASVRNVKRKASEQRLSTLDILKEGIGFSEQEAFLERLDKERKIAVFQSESEDEWVYTNAKKRGMDVISIGKDKNAQEIREIVERDNRAIVLPRMNRCYEQEAILLRMGISSDRMVSYNASFHSQYRSMLPQTLYKSYVAACNYEWTGIWPDLDHPKTFNEIMMTAMIDPKQGEKTFLSDKYLVRKWVDQKIGKEYLIPLIADWENVNDIVYADLPNKYVLKLNHGCGWNIISTEKNQIDTILSSCELRDWMRTNFAFFNYEMQYKNIRPHIICEEYLENRENDVYDYKVFCFHGVPQYIMFLCERKTGLKMAFFDTKWKRMPFVYSFPSYDGDIEKPKSLDLLLELSSALSKGFDQVRVDWYVLNDGTVKFGEMTFTSCAGHAKWEPAEWGTRLGDLWSPTKNTCPPLGDKIAVQRQSSPKFSRKYRIMIETTSICNAKCVFCPNSTLQRPHMVMKEETFHKIIQRIKDENIEVERFILHLNGEPFTDPNLIHRIQELKNTFPKASVWFTSNFSLPDSKKIEELLRSGLDVITISLNSVNENQYRKVMGGLEYRRTIKNLKYLLKRNQEMGNLIKVRTSIIDTGKREDVAAFRKEFSSSMEVRVIQLGQWVEKEKPLALKDNPNNRGICQDLLQQICILSNGDYAYCCFDAEGHIGMNIMDVPMLQAFHSEKFESLRQLHKTEGRINSMCRNCSFSY